jgi:hypothetical protein
MRIKQVSKEEFTLEDGSVFQIEPPLDYEPELEEFQKHYDRAREFTQSLKDVGGNFKNSEDLG